MILALALLVTLETSAQKYDKYVQVMQKNITLLDSAKSIDELQSLAGTFDRIGDAESMLIRIFGKDAVMWHSEGLERSGAVGQSGAEALVQRHRPRH